MYIFLHLLKGKNELLRLKLYIQGPVNVFENKMLNHYLYGDYALEITIKWII